MIGHRQRGLISRDALGLQCTFTLGDSKTVGMVPGRIMITESGLFQSTTYRTVDLSGCLSVGPPSIMEMQGVSGGMHRNGGLGFSSGRQLSARSGKKSL